MKLTKTFSLAFLLSLLALPMMGQWAGSATINNDIYRNGNVGIGYSVAPAFLVAPLDVRGNNIYLAPTGTSGVSNKFVGLGESGGQCLQYGFRAQQKAEAFINVGVKNPNLILFGTDPFTPTISWGDTATIQRFVIDPFTGQITFVTTKSPRNLDFEFDGNDNGCGNRVAYMSSPGSTYQLTVLGDALASGGVWQNSDARFKSDIRPINSALDMINNLNGVTYSYKNNEFPEWNFTQGRSYGFIAQELKEVMPEAVQTDENGYLAVQYDAVIPVLTEALKDQQEVIENQNEKIQSLEERLAKIEAMLAGNSLKSSNEGQGLSAFADTKLFQNQPNPFNEVTTIRYSLGADANSAKIVITDLTGKIFQTYPLNQKGEGSVMVQANTLSAGTYIYTLYVDGNRMDSRRMVLNK